jgi:L-alanine-DL-glutamate epimerase-like enolase superfamily enzyme
VTGEGVDGARAVVEGPLRDAVVGLPIDQPEEWGGAVRAAVAANPSARAAVDVALWDLYAQGGTVPLANVLGAPLSPRVRTDMTVSVADVDTVLRDADAHIEAGFRTLKIKLGTDPARDDAVVRALRTGPAAAVGLRVDANQGWSADDAIRLIRGWEDDGLRIDLVEQPTPAYDVEALAAVTRAVATPVLADESFRDERDLRELVRLGAADAVNVKLAKCGGISAARGLIGIARSAGLGVVVGCMLESVVGISAAAGLAATLPGVVHDLDAGLWLAEAPLTGGVRYESDEIVPAKAPGLGFREATDRWAA